MPLRRATDSGPRAGPVPPVTTHGISLDAEGTVWRYQPNAPGGQVAIATVNPPKDDDPGDVKKPPGLIDPPYDPPPQTADYRPTFPFEPVSEELPPPGPQLAISPPTEEPLAIDGRVREGDVLAAPGEPGEADAPPPLPPGLAPPPEDPPPPPLEDPPPPPKRTVDEVQANGLRQGKPRRRKR